MSIDQASHIAEKLWPASSVRIQLERVYYGAFARNENEACYTLTSGIVPMEHKWNFAVAAGCELRTSNNYRHFFLLSLHKFNSVRTE